MKSENTNTGCIGGHVLLTHVWYGPNSVYRLYSVSAHFICCRTRMHSAAVPSDMQGSFWQAWMQQPKSRSCRGRGLLSPASSRTSTSHTLSFAAAFRLIALTPLQTGRPHLCTLHVIPPRTDGLATSLTKVCQPHTNVAAVEGLEAARVIRYHPSVHLLPSPYASQWGVSLCAPWAARRLGAVYAGRLSRLRASFRSDTRSSTNNRSIPQKQY